MALSENYAVKITAIPAYFGAILDARPPERFSIRFLENLGFTSTNDRLFIGILKDLGFLNRDGTPQPMYFEFLDRGRSKQVLAAGIADAYSDLFAINKKANELSQSEVKNKLRTLFAGKKSDNVIGRIANTFKALCDYADFTATPELSSTSEAVDAAEGDETDAHHGSSAPDRPPSEQRAAPGLGTAFPSLQYHINIALPESRDQAVYDAIFKSLREHLG